MKERAGFRTAAVWAGAAAWTGLAIVSFPLIVRLALALAAAACVIYYIMAERRMKEAENRQHLLRMLNHHRHDWMNELQVLFGYVRLKKYEILPDYMDKIKVKALHDSYLAKLGNPALTVFLLDKRIDGGSCAVEVELETEIDLRKLAWEEQDVYALIRGITDQMTAFVQSAQGDPGTLSIGFDEEESQLLVDFVYQGEADWEGLRSGVGSVLQKWTGKLEIREEEYGEGQAVVALALPFLT